MVLLDAVDSTGLLVAAEGFAISQWVALVERLRRDWLADGVGRLVKSTGDGMLLEFVDVRRALSVVLQISEWVEKSPTEYPHGRRLCLRAGVHVAEVLVHDIDLFGLGVHVVARLASLAGPGETVLSEEARDECADGLDGHFIDLGERYAKGLPGPMRCYRFMALDTDQVPRPPGLGSVNVRPVIAVVPPLVTGAAADDDVLGYVIADDLIAGLSKCPQVTVISRLSTAAFRSNASVDHLRRNLGAAYAITGRVRTDGVWAELVLELCETSSGQVLWAVDGRAGVGELLHSESTLLRQALQSVARRVVQAEVESAYGLPVSTLAGYTLYVAGLALMHRQSRPDFERARELLDALTTRHPRCASAHALLAKWHVMCLVQGWSRDPRHDGHLARELARAALELDPEHSFAMSVDALVAAHFSADLDRAVVVCDAAIDADAQEAHAWLVRAGLAVYQGDGERAERSVARAIELSPMDPARFAFDVFAAASALTSGHLDAAVSWARASIRRHALHAPAHRTLAIALAMAGRTEEAAAAGAQLLRVDPSFTVSSYAARYPGRTQPHASLFCDALRAAGLPT